MKKSLIILGNGGHAKVILDIFLSTSTYKVHGFISNEHIGEFMGFPILGTDKDLPNLLASGVTYAFVAVGNNDVRHYLSKYVLSLGFQLANAISPYAIISPFAMIKGYGNAIMPGAIINSCSEIGEGCILNTSSSVDHDCHIGNYTHIAPGAVLAGNVTIGNNTFLGTGCSIINNRTIGHNTIVGAGAVVIHDLPNNITAFGIPACIHNTP